MDIDRQMQIEQECIRVSNAFSYHIDHRNYRELADLFTQDGFWIRHGIKHKGRAEIITAMEKRPANQFTRHVTTGYHFLSVTETTARSMAYNMSYGCLDADPLPGRYDPELSMLLDFADVFVKTPNGWRIAERVTTEVLIPDKIREILAKHH